VETVFSELKRYVGFGETDEAALRALHPVASGRFAEIADIFYRRILDHEEARKVLEGGESQAGRLKPTLVAWMDKLLSGPWDDEYYELRSRIGRVHVRIALPQHYMFGAMNVIRRELNAVVDTHYAGAELYRVREALAKILDLELSIMLHTYREDLVAQQERIQRLSTFGQLVGSIGHELRNPLGVMESSLYLLKSYAGSDERVQKHVNRIGEQITLANSIISSLLDLIRDKPLARESVRPAAILDAAQASVPVPAGVRVHMDGWADLPEIDVDVRQVRQVFVNLFENAVHAAGDAGEVWLSARAAGARLECLFEDDGKGLDPAVRARLFEPLVTTKGKGIGLGLALVKRIVERHGGTVAYAPRPGGGARFTVALPLGRHA
jgi:two-component system sensor histidine kinase HydH